MTRLLSCAAIVIFALPSVLLAQGSLEDLTKPIEGRSMRATSSFRGTLGGKKVTKDGKERLVYDPNADFLSAPGEETSNSDNFTVEPGKTHVLLGCRRPRRHYSYMAYVPRSRAAGVGPRRGGQPSGNAAADLL